MTTTTTQTINPDGVTAVPCPSWCDVDHAGWPAAGGFHASGNPPAGLPMFRLWQTDQLGCPMQLVIGGETLSVSQVYELGIALIDAADELEAQS